MNKFCNMFQKQEYCNFELINLYIYAKRNQIKNPAIIL